jgi:hypothetical protein
MAILDLRYVSNIRSVGSRELTMPSSLGPILLGTFLNVWFYGILITQVTLYYVVHKQCVLFRSVCGQRILTTHTKGTNHG